MACRADAGQVVESKKHKISDSVTAPVKPPFGLLRTADDAVV
jgi:hypothetical protein